MKELTKEQAIKFAESGIWKDWSAKQIVDFQLFQDKLCMDFNVYKKALENVLERPVYTDEIGNRDSLIKEYLGEKEPPTLDEILNLIPENKRIILEI